MRTKLSLFPATATIVAIMAVAAFFAGCSSTTEPTNNTPSTVSFTQNAKFTYTEQRRDTTGGTYGNDGIDPTSTDTVHSTVVDTNMSIYGKTHVVAIYNHRTRNENDTAYIWQDGSGNVYRYNYGADILNNIGAVTLALGHRLEVGWVLQAKMSASTGTGWIAARDTENITLLGQSAIVTIRDSATRVADTTITVAGSTTTCVHTVHSVAVTLSSLPVATVRLDNYESATGEVRNTVHTFAVSIPTQPVVQVSGQERVMIAKQ